MMLILHIYDMIYSTHFKFYLQSHNGYKLVSLWMNNMNLSDKNTI